MNKEYYDSIDRMEKSNVSRDFVLGWAAGYLGKCVGLNDVQAAKDGAGFGFDPGADCVAGNGRS